MSQLAQKLGIVMLLALLSACATNNDIYYWGDYSETAYEYQSTPTDKTETAHINAMKEIIADAGQKNKRIPPGIYAELAYFAIKHKDYKQAKAYLEREQALFPESSVLVSRLLNKMKQGA